MVLKKDGMVTRVFWKESCLAPGRWVRGAERGWGWAPPLESHGISPPGGTAAGWGGAMLQRQNLRLPHDGWGHPSAPPPAVPGWGSP